MASKSELYADFMVFQQEVTGSCRLIVARFPNHKKISFLVDLGSFQEKEYRQSNDSLPFKAMNISFILLTHNHIDHIGRVPFAVKQGFTGPIYCSELTKTFMRFSLMDTCYILGEQSKKEKKKPLYKEEHVEQTLSQVKSLMFNTDITVEENISVRFIENAHTVGSIAIQVTLSYPGEKSIVLFFSGDYAKENSFISVPSIASSLSASHISAMFLESTYGDTLSSSIEKVFEKNITEYAREGFTILVPVFSFQRAQEILLFLCLLQKKGLLSLSIPIYLDGKLSICYTKLFKKISDDFKQQSQEFLPENLTFVDKKFRMQILKDFKPKIVLASSGMLCGGPSPTYLWNWISHPKFLVHLVGYPAENTLSRDVYNASKTGVFKKTLEDGREIAIPCAATVLYTQEFSAHAKQDELLELIQDVAQCTKLESLHIGHGSIHSRQRLFECVTNLIPIKHVSVESKYVITRIGADGVIKQFSSKF